MGAGVCVGAWGGSMWGWVDARGMRWWKLIRPGISHLSPPSCLPICPPACLSNTHAPPIRLPLPSYPPPPPHTHIPPHTHTDRAHREVFGELADFLREGLDVTLLFHGDDAVTGEVERQVTLVVAEAAPTMKGETAAPSYKRAVCEGGIEVCGWCR